MHQRMPCQEKYLFFWKGPLPRPIDPDLLVGEVPHPHTHPWPPIKLSGSAPTSPQNSSSIFTPVYINLPKNHCLWLYFYPRRRGSVFTTICLCICCSHDIPKTDAVIGSPNLTQKCSKTSHGYRYLNFLIVYDHINTIKQNKL